MARPFRIAPSILSADFARLAHECEAVLNAGADWLHVDVMDGHFVPNLTIGLPVVESLRKSFPEATLDVHLMISNPDDFAGLFAEAGADIVSFHPEATAHTHRIIQDIHSAGARASLAINPGTSLDAVEWVLDEIEMILLMSVNPGFGGQLFIESTLSKLNRLGEMLERRGLADTVDVEVDGGIKVTNIASVREAGANVFVAGSAIFNSDNYRDAIDALRSELGEPRD